MYHIRHLTICTLCLIAVSVLVPCSTCAGSSAAQSPPDEAHRQAADALLQQLWPDGPGHPQFGKIDTVVKGYNQSDVATQNAIGWLCVAYMKDESREIPDRWPCCYVIGRSGYEQGVPDLIDVLQHDSAEAMRATAAEALGEMYNSTGNATIRDALLQAAQTDSSKRVLAAIARHLSRRVAAPVAPVAPVVPVPNPHDNSHRKAADALLRQIWSAQLGAPKFDAIDAVVRKYKQSDAATRKAIIWLCLTYMNDKSRVALDRWPCIYVLCRSHYMDAAPAVIDVLLHDVMEAMRAVAAEALGGLFRDTGNTAIRSALIQAARTDKSKWVRDTIAKYLGKDMPAPHS